MYVEVTCFWCLCTSSEVAVRLSRLKRRPSSHILQVRRLTSTPATHKIKAISIMNGCVLLCTTVVYIWTDFLPPQQWIDDLQRVGVCSAEAASFAAFSVFFSPCTSGLCKSLWDDTQRKGPCDWVKDHSAWGLGDRLTPANIEADQSRNIVKAILLKLEQLPRVALSHRWRHKRKYITHGPIMGKLNYKRRILSHATNMRVFHEQKGSFLALFTPQTIYSQHTTVLQ